MDESGDQGNQEQQGKVAETDDYEIERRWRIPASQEDQEGDDPIRKEDEQSVTAELAAIQGEATQSDEDCLQAQGVADRAPVL
jgi:hypothetical protein